MKAGKHTHHGEKKQTQKIKCLTHNTAQRAQSNEVSNRRVYFDVLQKKGDTVKEEIIVFTLYYFYYILCK